MPYFQDFANVQNQPCFYRITGVSGEYLQKIQQMDADLSRNCNYLRIQQFAVLSDKKQIEVYQQNAQEYRNQPEFQKMLELYHQSIRQVNPTIEKNLLISAAFWYDTYLKERLSQPGRKKFVCSGKIGYKEYLFCYLAYLKGFDVLVLLPEGDLPISPVLLNCSGVFAEGQPGNIQIPPYQKPKPAVSRPQPKINTVHRNGRKQNSVMKLLPGLRNLS